MAVGAPLIACASPIRRTAKLQAAESVGTNIGDPKQVGCSGRAERNAGGDDHTVPWACEFFLIGNPACAIDHVVEVSSVVRHDAMRSPNKAQPPRGLDNGRQRDDWNVRSLAR